MKFLATSVILVILLSATVSSKHEIHKTCNYIESNYYQYIYNADIEYKKENRKKAYEFLKLAENTCEMINLIGYYEIETYVELLLENDETPKALYYINTLISDKGYRLQDFSSFNDFYKLTELPQWDSIKSLLNTQEKLYISDTSLAEKLHSMGERDQYYRTLIAPFYHSDSLKDVKNNKDYNELYFAMRSVDDSNYNELITIISELGFPLSKNLKMSSVHQSIVYTSLFNIITHAATDSLKVIELSPILLSNIAAGNCPPLIYAMMIDKYSLEHRKPFVYGMFGLVLTETGDMRPIAEEDYEDIDKKRIAIGLPPMAIEKEKQDYIMRLFSE